MSRPKFVHQRYFTLTSDQKKQMVSDFFRLGGKKQGLTSTYEQTMAMQTKASGGNLAMYVNIGTLMDIWKVSLIVDGFRSCLYFGGISCFCFWILPWRRCGRGVNMFLKMLVACFFG